MKSKLQEIEDRLEQDREIDAIAPSDDELIQVGRLMRTLREARGLTQRQVQRLSGVDQAEISRIEAGVGTRGMTVSQMSTLARAQHARVVMVLVDESLVDKEDQNKLKIEIEGQAALAKVVL
jgi:transcriptional regulator with XRE-family HTH domain